MADKAQSRHATRWAKLPEMVRSGDDLMRLYQLSYALFLPDFQAELLNGAARHSRMRSGLPPAAGWPT